MVYGDKIWVNIVCHQSITWTELTYGLLDPWDPFYYHD